MAKLTMYHNRNCGTSKKVLARLQDAGADVEVIEYLKAPPTKVQLDAILGAIGDPPADLVRKDPRFKELGLDPGSYTTKAAVVKLLREHPELMQRPVVLKGARGVIARPPERVDELL